MTVCNLSIFAAVKGDVNGDGHVSSVDVTAIYNWLLNGDASNIVNGDVDGDGHISSVDVTAIYNILLGNDVPAEHEWVDLGLPSGTKWACCNIGANSPTEYGNYYAWGETQPKSVYNWDTYKWGSDWDELTKYCTDSYYGKNGFVDNKTELDLADDAAYVNWGSGWRMPSLTQLQELRNNCTSEWTTRNGVNGRLFTSNINGASLFLPAAGYRWGSEFIDAGTGGYFWSRTLYSSNPKYACELLFYSCHVDWSYYYRGNGQSVRAVRVSQN